MDGLAHRGEVVRALDRLDDELAVIGLLQFPALADHHAGDILGSLNIRDIERFDAVREGGQTDEQRIVHAFRRVLSRPPSEREKARLAELLAKQKQYIADGWVNALDLSTGRNQLPEGLPAGVTPTELAAYVVVSRVLLNLDETITRE